MILQIGMKVRIKKEKYYREDSGKIKKITAHLPDFDNKRAFQLDNENGAIWLIEDFEENTSYPEMSME